MKREEFDQLLDFCVGQLRNFDAAAWLGAPVAARGRLADRAATAHARAGSAFLWGRRDTRSNEPEPRRP
jgi:hypothetical protein